MGLHRGGHGVIREYEFLADATLSILAHWRKRRPSGAEGGGSGARGRNLLDGDVIVPKGNSQVRRGDRLRIERPRGGGSFPEPGDAR
ncbi:MAG: hydantoinase B/oxoprolinase family protein [Bryobacterales bacterium]|nr:hydantoinase B/oxoprolinase family protein [Bryobacterales bacterium]